MEREDESLEQIDAMVDEVVPWLRLAAQNRALRRRLDRRRLAAAWPFALGFAAGAGTVLALCWAR